MKPKLHTVSASRVTNSHIVLPSDTNNHGTIFGGIVMQWLDIAASISATRHCRLPVVTASIDNLYFLHPIKLGYHVHITAEVSFTGKSSMELEATVVAENPLTGEQQTTCMAHLTFVAVGADGKPVAVPAVIPESASEKARFDTAKRRKAARLQQLQQQRHDLE